MKIKYLVPEAIDNLKETLISSHGKHLLDETPDYFIKYFSSKGWLRETTYDIPDVRFEMGSDYNNADAINIIRIHKSMGNLPLSLVSDECIWAGLAFTDMWQYVQYRRYAELRSGNRLKILSSFFFMRGVKRSAHIHCLSRLWWTAYLLYDKNNKNNPYELSTFFASRAYPSRIMLFSSINILANPESAKGFVQCQYDRKKQGKNDGRYQFTDLGKHFNKLGGIVIIDALSRQEVYDISMKFLEANFPN